MTEPQFAALFYNPKREHDPLMVKLKDGRNLMVIDFDGSSAILFGGGKVPIDRLRYVGGVELREE